MKEKEAEMGLDTFLWGGGVFYYTPQTGAKGEMTERLTVAIKTYE